MSKQESFFQANLLPLIFALLILSGGFFAYNEFFVSKGANPTILGSFEYSPTECLNGSLWLLVFNPGPTDVSNISVFSGSTVYHTLDSLEPDSPVAFPIGPCDSTDVSELMISYCAGLCYEEPLDPEGRSGSGEKEACEPADDPAVGF